MKRILFIAMGVLFLGTAIASVTPPVNINKADVKELASLKGIGAKKAKAIVANRKQSGPFHSVNELARIKGIGKAFIQRLLKSNPNRVVLKTAVH